MIEDKKFYYSKMASLIMKAELRFGSYLPTRLRMLAMGLRQLRYGTLEIKLIRLLCPSDTLAFDIGANLGQFSFFMSRHAKGTLLFEPLPHLYKQLIHNFPVAKVINKALSDHPHQTLLRIPEATAQTFEGCSTIEQGNTLAGRKYTEIEVDVDILDNYDIGKVGLIKIDVEGHEHSVLMGGQKLIEKHKPNVIIESEQRHNSEQPQGVFQFFLDRGYQGLFVQGDHVKNLAEFSVETHQKLEEIEKDSGIRNYVNNFIFIRKELFEKTASEIQGFLRE